MASLQKKWKGLAFCLLLAVPSWPLGRMFPIIGDAIIAVITGMVIAVFMKNKNDLKDGIEFTSKRVLQWVIILLGFGMNLNVVLETGKQSPPIIICTTTTSLVTTFALHKLVHIPSNVSTLVGVGSSIRGGSAITATAPVINADDDEVTQAISVIFFFNVLAAILFPTLGKVLRFDTASDNASGVFAGTATDGTSSVTVAAATWDNTQDLGAATLDETVTVKLTRTLAIIPITFCLIFIQTRKEKKEDQISGQPVSFKDISPFFILYSIGVSIITAIAVGAGIPASVFAPIKESSKFSIILAMAVVGLNMDLVELIRASGEPMLMDAYCWMRITAASLGLQSTLGIWQHISIRRGFPTYALVRRGQQANPRVMA